MAKTLIPVYQLGDHCEPEHINNFEMAPFSDFILNTGLFDNVQANPVIDIPPAAMTGFEELLLKMNAEFINNETDKEQVLSVYREILG
jgi:hypothetical protein